MHLSLLLQEKTLRRVLFATAAILGLNFWSLDIGDPDLGWQLLGGAWIHAHRTVPSYDFINTFNSHWLDYHWFAQGVLYSLYSLGGYPLLRLFFGLMMAYIFVVILDIIMISMGRYRALVLPLLLLIIAAVFLAQVSSVRPQMISVAIVAVAVRRLIQKPAPWELLFLIFLTILLANIHVYWIFIPFFWGCYRFVPAILRRKKVNRSLAFSGLLLLPLCGLLTPYGISNYSLILEYAAMPAYLKEAISEFRGALSVRGNVPIILVVYLILLAKLARPKRLLADCGGTLAALATLVLSLRSIKFVALFALAGQPLVAKYGIRALRKYVSLMARRELLFGAVALYPVALIGLGFVIAGFPFLAKNQLEEHSKKTYPIPACEALARVNVSPSNKRTHVRVLTHFNDGGWCRWSMHLASPGQDFRVTTDGRTQFVPVDLYKKSFDLYALKKDWRKTLDEWAPDAIVVGRNYPLAQVLPLLNEWRQLYQDEQFAVYLTASG